jgi:hypothetical protein
MKNIWKGIKQIINSKPRGSSSSPSKIIEGENVLTDSISIANAFNIFFANIGNNLATSIPSVEATPMDFMSNQQLNSIFLNPITSEEIILEINKLNSSKAVGPLSIPVNILKLTKDIISKPLEIIFNSSLLNGIVPDSFKISRIIPIHKKGSTMSLDNYPQFLCYQCLINYLKSSCSKGLINSSANTIYCITNNLVLDQNILLCMHFYQ